MKESQYKLPKPPSTYLIDKDWRPRRKGEKSEPNFWQLLTGHQKIFTQNDVDKFVNGEGKIRLRKSELVMSGRGMKETDGYLENSLGFPQELLHQSWLGVQDNLRIYVFES